MATTYTDESVTSISSPSYIPSTDYIGNSLSTINGNFDTLYQDILFLQKQIANVQTIPVGTVAFFAMKTAPTGWLICDGSLPTNMESLYPALYNLLGTTYNKTKGTLPDLRGQFIRGWNSANTGLDANRPGGFGSTQTDAFKSHTHTDSGHAHSYTFGGYGSGYAVTGTPGLGVMVNNLSPGGTGLGKAKLSNTGDPIETRPTNIALLGCIKW